MTWPSNFIPSLLETRPETSGLTEFVDQAANLKGWLDVAGLTDGGVSLALARAARESGRSLLVIAPSIPQADSLVADLEFFLPDREVHLFPAYGHLPFSRLNAHPWTVARRIRCLWRMISADKPLVVVAPAAAMLGRLTPQAVLNDFAELTLEGEEVDREALLTKLVQGGYTPTALVEEPGDLAVRGGIVDIFGALDDDPVRLEFFGDFVDSLRLFRPSDQRSIKIIQESIILPMSEVVLSPEALNRGRQGLARLDCDPAKILELREPLTNGLPFEGAESFLPLFYEKTESLLDYTAKNSLVCLVDPTAIEQQAAGFMDGLADRVNRLKESGSPHLEPERACHTWEEINRRLESMDGLAVRPLSLLGAAKPRIDLDCRAAVDLPPAKTESGGSILNPLLTTVRWLNENSISPWLVCRTSGQLTRLTGLLEEYGLTAVKQPAPPGRPPAQAADLHLIQGGLPFGRHDKAGGQSALNQMEVGRSSQKAYAYLLIPDEASITRDALKRLKVMMDFTHLGAGFKIAMHDLKIRGGGNLLGQAQAGHIGLVGYEMYLTLMEQAIAEIKGGQVTKQVDPELNLPFSAFLPESYIAEPNQRLALYRRLAVVKKERDLSDLIEEMNDRFGQPPAEVDNLIKSVRLRLTLRRLGVSRLDVNRGVASAAFVDDPPVNLTRLVELARRRPRAIKLTPDSKLIVHNRNPLGELEKIFGMLAKDL